MASRCTSVPVFPQRCHLSFNGFLRYASVCRIVLRHLQLIGIEFDHLAAGTFSLAFEMLHKLTHSPPVCRPSEAALKRSVIVFLNFDRAADLQQIVHKLTVVALAGGRQAPMVLGKL